MDTRPLIRRSVVVLALVLVQLQVVDAQDILDGQQTPRVATRPPALNENELRTKRHEVSTQLDAAVQELGRIQESDSDESKKIPVSQEVDLLKQRDAVLARQQTAESKKNQLTQRISELQAEIEQLNTSGLAAAGPISFVTFDQLENELESSRTRLESVEASVTVAAENLTSSRQTKEAKDAALRLARETLSSNRQEDVSAELESAVKTAELEASLADESLNLSRSLSENENLNKQVSELTIQLLESKTKLLADRVQFSQADLQEILVQIERQESEIRKSQKLAESRLQYAEREWSEARRTLDVNGETPEAKEELAARRVARQLTQQQFDVINLRLTRLSQAREIWDRRSKVFNSVASNSDLSKWVAETKQHILNLERERKVQALASDDIRKDITSLDSRLQALTEQTNELRPWIVSQISSWRDYLLANDDNLSSIDATLQLHTDLLQEIEGDIEHWTFGERVASVWAYIKSIWSTELTSIDDRPITIGKVVVGILLFFLGFLAAGIISSILGNRLLTRVGLNEGAVAALKSLTFYTLVVIFTLLALRFANVPLTVFTLLGGALAIGVGFGSQAIINNFISGLILLAERPIQVGDLVKIDDLIGTVTHIGARSTRIRTGDNLDIIVPNSKFLETNVFNFTLGDDKFRTHIKVGLAYGSPTRDASRLLVKAAEEHGQILENPKPFVWFRDFGDNSLVFELHVWIKVRTLGERLRIESDLRYRVDQLLREGGIVIAFPQRDVHLDVATPLDIRMLASDNPIGSDGDNPGRAA